VSSKGGIRVRKSLLRIGLGVMGAVGITAASMGAGTLHVSANTLINGYNLGGDLGCHNLNPILEANTSALTAVADNTRPYAQIKSVAVTAGAATADGITEAKVSFTLCGGIPTFPALNTDSGASWYACFDPASTQPIVSSSTGVVTNPAVPPLGNPSHDGPFPKSQGFRFCVWLSDNAGTGFDYGVAFSDPIDQFTFLDPANLFDANNGGAKTITAPAINAAAGTFDLFLPYIWRQTINPASPLQAVLSETVASAGDVTTDWNAQAWVNAEVNLPSPPAPICVPTLCVQGIIGLLVPVDFVPGYQLCTTEVIGCANFDDATLGRGVDLGIEMNFPIGSIQTPVNPVNPAADCPGPAGPDSTFSVSTGFGTVGAPWVYAPIYGRILPGPVTMPVSGQSLHPFGLMTPDNASETL
jgi:hypothetical protein